MLSRFAKQVVEFLKQEEVICLVAITALGTSANQTFGNVASAIGGS